MAYRITGLPFAAALLAFAAPVAAASLVHFETGGSDAVSFDIAERPHPASSIADGSFTLNNVRGSFGGVAGRRTIEFFNNSRGGGFQVAGGQGIFSQQVYEGGEKSPFIYVGDYYATDRATGGTVGLIIYGTGGSLVPEPASWALLVAGFGLIGAALRGRRRAVAA